MFPGLRSYLCAVAALALSAVCASAQDLARATIVDSSENTKEYAKQLADLAVTVIGRYYGRCPQWSPDRSKRIVRNKRMIDDAGEVDAILSDRRLGLLSVYQFYSQDSKFDNSRESGAVTVLDDRPRKSDSKTVADFNDCITPDKPNTIEEDAKLDGYAAIMQAAESIKQPKGTAIYFGVDFNLTDERRANVLKYFCIINKIVTDAGYQVGVYGNGAISDLLYENNLVKYVWLTASSAHEGSANTYNNKHWDLLQTKTNTHWVIGKNARGQNVVAELDTDVQNPASTYVGFWKKTGAFTADRNRNVKIHKARQFVCEGQPVVVDDKGQQLNKPICTQTFGIVVRTFATDAGKGLVRVDCDEDGVADGWMKNKDLSARRPLWIDDKNDRLRAHCPAQ